jgi:hypothetical protein
MPSDKEFKIDEHFDEELELINDQIREVNELYEELKTHYDTVKQSRNQGTLSFMHLQASNLVSLKNSKASLIKDRITVKKNIADLYMKDKQIGANSGSGGEQLSVHLFKLLSENNKIKPEFSVINMNNEESEEADRLLEEEIRKRIESGELSKDLICDISEEENNENSEEDEIKYICDTSGKIYIVNSNYEIQEGYEEPTFKVQFIEDENGIFHAIAPDGEEIEIVEFEE